MTSLTWGASNVQSLTVTGNDKLNTVSLLVLLLLQLQLQQLR